MIDLPDEIVLKIASFLDKKSQFCFAGVSKYFRFIIFKMIEKFSISCSALGNSLCFLRNMNCLKKLTVIGHYDQKICHMKSLEMLAVYVEDFHALKCIDLSGVKIDFLILRQIILNEKSLEIICARRSTP